MTPTRIQQRLQIGWFPVPGFLVFMAFIWFLYWAAVMGLAVAVDIWGDIENSAWEQAMQPLRFGVVFIGVWVVDTYLAVYVAHGVTRREFAERTAAFVVAFGLMLGVLMAVGYALEGLVYDAMGWRHEITDERLFSAPDEWALIVMTFTFVFAFWTALGVLNITALRRDEGAWGLLTIPLSLVPLAAMEISLGGQLPSFVHEALDFLSDPSVVAAIAISTVALVTLAAGTWALLRDIPIPAKTS